MLTQTALFSSWICFNQVFRLNFDILFTFPSFSPSLGQHASLPHSQYGYSTFEYDITPFLRAGDNLLAVRVSNHGKNSRWYAGSGIYRHVWLTKVNAVNIPTWGVRIGTHVTLTPGDVAAGGVVASAAVISTEVLVANTGTQAVTAVVGVSVSGPTAQSTGRHVVMEGQSAPVDIAANSSRTVSLNLSLFNASLWGPDNPVLYLANTTVIATQASTGERITDSVDTSFGLRHLNMSADHGLVLNGKPLKLRGGCMHHANGPLGAMAIDRAEERRVEVLKQHGFNAVRTSHNPPSPAFLDACDRLGMMVMDEAFDCWAQGKNPDDYHKYFADWWQVI